jgi:hypothetical protein
LHGIPEIRLWAAPFYTGQQVRREVLWITGVCGSSADGIETNLTGHGFWMWIVDPDEGYLVIFDIGKEKFDSEEMLLWQ